MPRWRCLPAVPAKSLKRWARIIGFTLLGITVTLLALLFVHRVVLRLLALLIPSLEIPFLDLAVYGAVPRRTYVSSPLIAPRPWRTLWDKSCDGGNILIAPYGPSVEQWGPVILDTNGEVVWMSHDFRHAMNFNVQTYKGKDYLTLWSGEKVGGSGRGEMLMLDSNYKVAYRTHAVGEGNDGDLHEFRITKDNTAIFTVSNNTQYDLRNFGFFRPSDGWLMDGVFQEVDIETNELLFEWRAIDHFDPADTYYFDPLGGFVESHSFDYYHLNSMEKDSKGNYLCSSRHYHHIIYIDGRTGDVLWALGGHSTDFTDLSDGKATEHQWQHNARWHDQDAGILTFMDNGVAGPLHVDAPYSKGTMVQLDLNNMTATHLRSYISPNKHRAASQGNLQILDNEQVIVGWGATGAYTEFSFAGDPICEVHFAASALFWFERFKTYRVYRHFGWVGKPDEPPTAVIQGNRVYVSWNGATEVRSWQLQGLREEGGQYEAIESVMKQHFEESFKLPKGGGFVGYRVAALDGQMHVLRYSEPATRVAGTGWLAVLLIGLCAMLGLAGVVWLVLRLCARRRGGEREGGFSWKPMELLRLRRRSEYQYSKLEGPDL